ncbi:MAG: hypothetical protein JXA90_16045 [Planctomycetes bacterium]|nr:hypothetical protein [Planctomycetota bacterium]
MRSAFFASFLTALMVAAVTSILISSLREEPSPPGDVDVRRLEDVVAALEQRVADLDHRIDAVAEAASRSRGEIASIRPAAASAATPGADADGASGTSDEAGAGEPEVAIPDFLASSSPEEIEQFRGFVADVIRQDREDQQKSWQENWRKQQQEFEELRKGPYGKFNFRVNSLAKKLELSDQQAQYYYENLAHFDERIQEIRKGVDWQNADSRQEYEDSRRALQEEFDARITPALSPEQAQAYRDAPEWERRLDSSGGFVWSATGAGAAPIQVNVGGSARQGSIRVETRTSSDAERK